MAGRGDGTMTDQRESIEAAEPGAGETEELRGLIVPEQPPMDDAAGGPQADDTDE
jgi:hypothetical protein